MVGFQQPKGFHRIRHYGLFTKNAGADNIARARELLAVAKPEGQLRRPMANLQKPASGGLSELREGEVSMRRTGWLGREDSNLRMVNSPRESPRSRGQNKGT
jgi:hypothetical protein